MNKQSLLSCIILCISAYLCNGQITDSSRTSKGTMHYIGLQSNALIRQLFNFGNASNSITNPYLLTYSAIGKKSRWGIDLGIGYSLSNSFDHDGNTKRQSDINKLNIRLGLQRLVTLNNKFSALVNIHFVGDLINNRTLSEENFNNSNTKINTKSNIMQYGLGPNLGLRYRISPRVYIGTEASYYFKLGHNKDNITITSSFQGGFQSVSVSEIDNDFKEFVLQAPAALFLVVQF